MSLAVQEFLTDCPVRAEYRDKDWEYIMFEYAMNFSLGSIREGYRQCKQKKAQEVDDNTLRELGYSEEDILRGRQ